MSGEMLDAFGARKAAEVMNETWGHLRPKPGLTYSGYILYSVGCYGDIVCLASHFHALPDSPWFYEDLHEYIGDNGEESGFVYLWRGTYNRDRTTKFVGMFERMPAGQLRNIMEKK